METTITNIICNDVTRLIEKLLETNTFNKMITLQMLATTVLQLACNEVKTEDVVFKKITSLTNSLQITLSEMFDLIYKSKSKTESKKELKFVSNLFKELCTKYKHHITIPIFTLNYSLRTVELIITKHCKKEVPLRITAAREITDEMVKLVFKLFECNLK